MVCVCLSIVSLLAGYGQGINAVHPLNPSVFPLASVGGIVFPCSA